jgi:hypothetical protein
MFSGDRKGEDLAEAGDGEIWVVLANPSSMEAVGLRNPQDR